MSAWLDDLSIARSEAKRRAEAERRRDDAAEAALAERLRTDATALRHAAAREAPRIVGAVAARLDSAVLERAQRTRARSHAAAGALGMVATLAATLALWFTPWRHSDAPAFEAAHADGTASTRLAAVLGLEALVPGPWIDAAPRALPALENPLRAEFERLERDGARAAAALVERLPLPLQSALRDAR